MVSGVARDAAAARQLGRVLFWRGYGLVRRARRRRRPCSRHIDPPKFLLDLPSQGTSHSLLTGRNARTQPSTGSGRARLACSLGIFSIALRNVSISALYGSCATACLTTIPIQARFTTMTKARRAALKYNTICNTTRQRTEVTFPFVWWDDALSDGELQKIIDMCEADGDLKRAEVLGTDPSIIAEIEKVRRCDIKFISRNDNTSWIFEKMNKVIGSLNDQFYGFELNGYDLFQYTSYNSEEKGTYHWHMDMHLGSNLPSGMMEPRKLSLTLLLNDDFEGGEFMINLGSENKARHIPCPKGRTIMFPSFMIHSVKPVTKGVRKSVVIWVTGPKFR